MSGISGASPTVALAFIMKDEGRYALQMLDSVAPLIDFVAFVDTGSTDGSVELVSRFLQQKGIPFAAGSAVFDRFDSARNASLHLIPQSIDWTLVLDCDEVLLEESFPEVWQLIGSGRYEGWCLPRYNWIDRIWGRHLCHTEAYPDYQGRLFRNLPDRICYRGALHETVAGCELGEHAPCGIGTDGHAHSLHIHHVKLFTKTREELASREKHYQRLTDAVATQKQSEDEVRARVLAYRADRTGEEAVFDPEVIRRVHVTPMDEFGRPGCSAYWCEWNHPNEVARPFSAIMRGVLHNGWRALIRPGSVCIDIGAHTGDTTIPMGILCGDNRHGTTGKVVAVEPNSDVRRVLELNLALNRHVAEFLLIPFAIAEHSYKHLTMLDHGNANCNGGLVHPSFGPQLSQRLQAVAGVRQTVDSLSLESLCRHFLSAQDQQRLSFIKIDCEGYDKVILRSSQDLLRGLQPALFIEWFDMFDAEQSADLFAAVSEIGYVAYEPLTWQPATPGRKVNDLVLLPKGVRVGLFG